MTLFSTLDVAAVYNQSSQQIASGKPSLMDIRVVLILVKHCLRLASRRFRCGSKEPENDSSDRVGSGAASISDWRGERS